jgi:hypothetical protein
VPLNKAAGSARNIEYSLKVTKGDRIYYLDTDLLEETGLMGCAKDQGDQKELATKIELPRKKERRRLRKAIERGSGVLTPSQKERMERALGEEDGSKAITCALDDWVGRISRKNPSKKISEIAEEIKESICELEQLAREGGNRKPLL